jgi:hypothetical protein
MGTKTRWKSIPGFEGVYSVSRDGEVRLEVDRRNKELGSRLRQTMDPDGYLLVRLSLDGSQKAGRNHRVNRLVGATFLGDVTDMQVNHKNGDKADNRLSNLEIVTPAENIKHAIKVLGYRRDGEHNNAAKLTERQVVMLRKAAARGKTYVALGKRFGITSVMACDIARGKAWPNAPGPIADRRTREYGRLSDEQKQEVRQRYKRGERAKLLADEFGVSRRTVYNIIDQ